MSSFTSDITHHFFKVYLPSHSSHDLKIPTTFIQKLNGGLVPGRSILRDPFGRSWNVEVEKVEDVFYFKAGWREFVEGNCLNIGDFIVFRFLGNSVFDVVILDNSECEKDENLEDIGEKEEQEEEEYVFYNDAPAFGELQHPYFIAYVKKNRPYCVHIPKSVLTANDITLKPEMILVDPDLKSWPVRVCFRKDGRIIITKGWTDFWTANNVTEHDKCIFEFMQDEGKGRKSNEIKVHIVRATRQVKHL